MSEGVVAKIEPVSAFARYRPISGTYDEAIDGSGQVRPHWRPVFEKLDALGASEIQMRWERARQDTTADGVTFNPYDTEGETQRPWVLDAIPVPIAERDWRVLSEGLAQRATLIDAVLHDLLGPQILLRERILPPDVFFGNPAYQPAYHHLRPPGRRHLDLYAADLSRTAGGSWCVTSDRTSTVSGLGYALENRVVAARMLPQLFRQNRVRRLAEFFVALKELVLASAPRSRENPRVVLWTEGPTGRRYFEDAYLARYLGYTLAEGGDLAVRSNRLCLKTLGGLLPVEVVLRRLDDALCDPVELHSDSTQGVPGLLEVLRARSVALLNPPGSGLLEAPVFLPFLPGACRRLLDADLAVPSVPTWWCGQPRERRYVLDHLDELLIREAFPSTAAPVWRPSLMSAGDRAELARAIEARPTRFVGQRSPRRSSTPVWNAGGVESWHLALRAFLASRGDGYVRLPGGLARVSRDAASLDHTMGAGERSQDVWILSDAPVETTTLLATSGESIPLRRGGADLPSRVADNLYWLGRSVESAEGLARLSRTLLLCSIGESQGSAELPVLVRALSDGGLVEPSDDASPESNVLTHAAARVSGALFNENVSGSFRSRICDAQRFASLVRDRVSVDAWRIVQRLDEMTRRMHRDPPNVGIDEALRTIERAITELAAFAGLASESMTRTPAWRFLDLGRRIARSLHTTRLLRSTLVHVAEDERAVFEAVLRIADSLMTYRSRYLATVQAPPVIDLLLTDDTNPRSVLYQLAVIADHVSELPHDESRPNLGPDQRLALSLQNAVRLADASELSRPGNEGRRDALERLLQRLSEQLPRLSDALSSRFLTHAGLPRHLASWEDRRFP